MPCHIIYVVILISFKNMYMYMREKNKDNSAENLKGLVHATQSDGPHPSKEYWYGLRVWSMEYGVWTMGYGLWTMDYELWSRLYNAINPSR
jgi:hypothetical protein